VLSLHNPAAIANNPAIRAESARNQGVDQTSIMAKPRRTKPVTSTPATAARAQPVSAQGAISTRSARNQDSARAQSGQRQMGRE